MFAVSDESALREKLRAGTGVIELPAGVVEVSSEIVIPATAHDLEIRGASAGTVVRATTTFQGRASSVCTSQVTRPELTLGVTAPEEALAGQTVTFQIAIGNNGPGAARDVTSAG